MKKLLVRLSVLVGTAALVAGCVSDADLGVKNQAITEAESPIRFNYPPVEGGFRKILAGRSVNYRQKFVTASFGPKSGSYPALTVWFRKLTNNNYYFPTRNFDEHFNWFYEVPPAYGDVKFVVHKFGRANYATYEENGGHCMFFNLKWGGHLASQGGNRMINGIFCDASPIDSAKAKKVINSVELLNNGEVMEVTSTSGPIVTSNLKADTVEITWNGVFDKRKISLSYRMYTGYDGVITFYDPRTGTCKGDITLDEELDKLKAGDQGKGAWNVECTEGQSAKGDLKIYAAGEGKMQVSGEGNDNVNNEVSFTM